MKKKTLLIRPSMAPKTNPKQFFCSKSLPTMGTWILRVNLYVLLQSLCKKSQICDKNLIKVTQNLARVNAKLK